MSEGVERAVRRKVQYLAALPIVVVEIQTKQEGATFFQPLAAQFDLILPPSLARHDETCAKGDPAPRLQFVETERPHDVIGRRQKGAPAALAMLDRADRHRYRGCPSSRSRRTIPPCPSCRALSCVSRRAQGPFVRKRFATAGSSARPCMFGAKTARRDATPPAIRASFPGSPRSARPRAPPPPPPPGRRRHATGSTRSRRASRRTDCRRSWS